MKRSLRAAVAAGVAAVVPAAGAADVVCRPDAPLAASVRLDYQVSASRGLLALAGDGSVTYRGSGNVYAMTSSVQAAGIFEAQQTSDGRIGPDGLVPLVFTQQTSRRPPLRVDFDWAAGQVAFSQNGNRAPTRPQMQDRLSLLVQLAWRSRSDPGASTVEIPVAGHRSPSTYVFVARHGEAVELPAGRFDAVKFERVQQGGNDLLEVWLAPGLCSLPVRFRFSDDRGTVIEQKLRAVEALGP